jgi:hypothetical protein
MRADRRLIRLRIEGLNAEALAKLLMEVWPSVAPDMELGALATITDRAIRIRRLPISSN